MEKDSITSYSTALSSITYIGATLSGLAYDTLNYFFRESEPIQKPAITNGWLKEIDDYERMTNEVYAERRQLIEKLNFFKSSKSNGNHPKFFTESLNTRELSSVNYDSYQLVLELYKSINSYPEFNPSRAKQEVDYVKNIHKEMEEHHMITMQLADECFKKLDDGERQKYKIPVSQVVFS